MSINNEGLSAKPFQSLNKPKFFEVSKYSDKDRVVVLVWHFTGIIENGGFDSFFSRNIPGDPDLKLFRKAFKEIECEDAVKKAVTWFDKMPKNNKGVIDNKTLEENKKKIDKYKKKFIRKSKR